MPKYPTNLNLALIVHRLLCHFDGWRVDELQEELGIKDRTYRKYRSILKGFPPFQDGPNSHLVEEGLGKNRALKLNHSYRFSAQPKPQKNEA